MKLRNLIYIAILLLGLPSAGVCDEVKPRLYLESQVLLQDTTWSGEVVIKGVVVIGRTATLTIEPGTTISFLRVDSNNDGIGDSEIRVLGQIIAEGSAESPISFRSAESSPAPKDWSYLLLFTSGKKNLLRYCNFEHAFTGLQIHFSTAHVRDCTFNNNLEGIRFGRAKIKIEHNLITNNTLGIRFTRMEGPATISNNLITQNGVGIFIVPSGQNIVDFFEPGRTGKAWNEGHLEIYANSVYNNSQYNLKLGAKQMWNLKIPNNWWGTSTYENVLSTIFDKHRDDELGQAKLKPILIAPEPTTGPRQTNK